MMEEEGVESGRGALIKKGVVKKLVVGLCAKAEEHMTFQR